jgi:hypothetical protein
MKPMNKEACQPRRGKNAIATVNAGDWKTFLTGDPTTIASERTRIETQKIN